MDQPSRSTEVSEAGALLLQSLVGLAKRDPRVRSALRTLLRAVESGEANEPNLLDKVLTPRGTSAPKSEPTTPSRPPRRVELSVIVRRARWKAAACRLAIDKRGASGEEGEIARLEENLRKQRTSLEDCWAWMLDTPRSLPEDALLEDVAACYDTVALAAESAQGLEELGALTPKPPAELLYLLAEAQSALLSSLHKCDLRGDSDQRDLFLWLKDQTTRHRIYVDRHMRLDDPADSKGSEALTGKIKDLVRNRSRVVENNKARTRLVSKIRYHAGKAGGDPTDADLRAVEAAAEEWIKLDLPVRDRELVPLLADLVGDREPSGAMAKVLGSRDSSPRDFVGEAKTLLEGKQLLFFGCDGQEGDVTGWKEAFELESLTSVLLTEEATAMADMSSALEGDSADLVLISYRLPHEEYGEFKRMCMDRDLPFVRLPGDLDVGTVAHQVLRQVAWRLRQDASVSEPAS